MKINRSCAVGIAIGIAVLCLTSPAIAEDPYEVAWTGQIGTSTTEESFSVAVDASGNAYISGYTAGSLGGTSAGSYDAFLTKFDTSGNELWTQQIGTARGDYSKSVAVDASGNAYISGPIGGDLGGTYAGGAYDAFLTKFDASGNELWSQQIGTGSSDCSYSVAVDGSGNTYISGYTQGDLGGTNAGAYDAFLTKFDTSGNELWTQQIGTATDDQSYSVALDASGNAYISGSTQGDLGGTNAGGVDAFLVKFDTSGNELWSQQIGTASSDRSRSVAVDASGNVYISGYTYGDLGGANAGDGDAFLIKLDSSGNELWTQQIGTASQDWSYSVAVDASSNAYISGRTYGDLGGPFAGDVDAFLVKFENPVPEPATMSLLVFGGLVMLNHRPTRRS